MDIKIEKLNNISLLYLLIIFIYTYIFINKLLFSNFYIINYLISVEKDYLNFTIYSGIHFLEWNYLINSTLNTN